MGDVAGPLVQHDPDGLLGGEVGVPAPGPQAGRVEAAVQVGPGVGWWWGGGFEVGLFGGLEVCGLLVCVCMCVWSPLYGVGKKGVGVGE